MFAKTFVFLAEKLGSHFKALESELTKLQKEKKNSGETIFSWDSMQKKALKNWNQLRAKKIENTSELY